MSEFDPTTRHAEIPGLPGYRFGSDGSFWSRHKGNRWKQVKGRRNTAGRIQVCIVTPDGRVIYRQLSRLILEAFVGPCPEGLECCHYDGNLLNNRLDNLRWDTHRSNMQDQLRHGTYPYEAHRGSRNNASKLTEADIPRIRRWYSEGKTQWEIARLLGVTQITISRVLRGETWKHIGSSTNGPTE